MPHDTCIEGTYMFRGVEYVINMTVKDNSIITLTVEDRLTANQWKGSFDSTYIEDMTHKTGNYKQFHVFINMVESAITQTSDSLTMDLLTFSDLELLRKKKAGVGTHSIPGANNPSLTQKRYLILTYTVEFDKIHYPLPLPYAGKPDPEILQETIRELQSEIKALRSQESKDYRIRELEKLKTDYDQLMAEKDAVEQEYLLFRKEVKHTSSGASTKEIRILKTALKNLEEELMKEKAKHQRVTAKRRKEHEDLLDEVQELRASERTLKVRVKSLTNELAVYKRKAVAAEHGRTSRRDNISQNNVSWTRERSLSRERGRSLSSERGRPNSRSRLGSDRRPSSSYEIRSASFERRQSSLHHKSPSPNQRRRQSPSSGLRPSPAGTRRPRFDPTAYVAEKKKQQVAKSRPNTSKPRPSPNRPRSSPGLYDNRNNNYRDQPNRQMKRKPVNTSSARNDDLRERSIERRDRGLRRGRTSSVESLGSVGSAGSLRRARGHDSYDKFNGNLSDSSSLGHSDRKISKHSRQNVGWYGDSSSENRYGKRSTPNTSTPNVYRRPTRAPSNSDTRSAAYSDSSPKIEDDIDARLLRIQEMMKAAI